MCNASSLPLVLIFDLSLSGKTFTVLEAHRNELYTRNGVSVTGYNVAGLFKFYPLGLISMEVKRNVCATWGVCSAFCNRRIY